MKKPDIYSYFDYRIFLKDLFEYRKSRSDVFSHRSIIAKAGFKSPNMLKNVMDGRRHLSPEAAGKFSRAFKLNTSENEYFLLLVRFNQSKSIKEKEKLFEKVLECKNSSSHAKFSQQQLEVLSKWYHLIIREIIALPDYHHSSKWISRVIRPRISPKQASDSLELLKKLGLIKKTGGKWQPVHDTLKTDPEVMSVLAAQFHRDIIKLGADAISEFEPKQREISATTLRIARKDVEKVRRMIRQFRDNLLGLAADSEDADQIYQLNYQFFPMVQVDRPVRHRDSTEITEEEEE